ncbi:MAG: FISUMP domain-containing protein, partial [Patescibacteria group bacterium]
MRRRFYFKFSAAIFIITALVFCYLKATEAAYLTNIGPSGGNVGIGTTNPGTKLETYKSAAAPASSGTSSTAFVRLQNADGGLAGDFGLMPSSPYGMWLQGTNRDNLALTFPLLLNPIGGNVGIVKTAPGAALDVVGAINSNSTVNGTGLCIGGECKASWAAVGSASSGWSQNGAEIYKTNTSGNVGIGTTSPGTKLDVVGSGNAVASFNRTDNTAVIALKYNSVTGGYLGTTGGNNITFYDSAPNASMVINSGNVGIGTTAPGAKLSFANATGEKIRMYEDGTNSFSLGVNSSEFALNLGATSRHFSFFGGTAQNNEVVRILGTGNVGIGMTDPGAKLTIKAENNNYAAILQSTAVSSNGDWTGLGFGNYANGGGSVYGNIIMRFDNPSGTSNKSLAFSTTGNPTGSLTEKMRITSGGNVGIVKTAPGAALDVVGAINSNSTVNGTGLCIGGECKASWAAVGSASSGWTQNGTEVYKTNTSGNVGIGTTNPSSLLEISDSGTTYGVTKGIALINSVTSWRMYIPASGQFALGASNGSNFWQAQYTPSGSAPTNLFTSPNAAATGGIVMAVRGLSGQTGNLFQWQNSAGTGLGGIDSSGNVGIGTTNPFVKLDINGALKLGDTSDTCDANHSGAFRYNATSRQSYVCDGTRWINQKNCGLMTDDAGQTYGTVQIGGQCWMAENINIGTMLVSGATEPNTANNVIEKWCYSNSTANCTLYGGLYNWNEAMRGSLVPGARGICPKGWHIPTDGEYNKLEKTVLGIIASSNSQYPCDFSVAGWRRCADNNGGDDGLPNGVGKSLKAIGQGSSGGAGDDLAGFGGKLSGYRDTDGSYYDLGWYLYLWSSTPNGASTAWVRYLAST